MVLRKVKLNRKFPLVIEAPMSSSLRPCLSILTVALLLSPFSFAFNVPLSDEAVREAYFLGQRHDESVASFLSKADSSLFNLAQ